MTPANVRAAALAALLVAALPLGALAKSSDRGQPMDIEAGASNYSLDDTRPTILSGGVTITQGTLRITAARAEITQRNGDPTRAVLTGGPVKLSQQLDDGTPMNASAARVDYDLTSEVVVFTGNVAIQQPRGSLSGAKVTYNMKTGDVASGGGGDGGRVKMRILPRTARSGG